MNEAVELIAGLSIIAASAFICSWVVISLVMTFKPVTKARPVHPDKYADLVTIATRLWEFSEDPANWADDETDEVCLVMAEDLTDLADALRKLEERKSER